MTPRCQVVALLVLLALPSVSCRRSADDASALAELQARPNVLLVTYCTMRADRWGVYAGGSLTPNIDAVAREAIVFRNHYSQASYSGGSFASIITGKYVFHHGIYDHPRRLGDEHVTLAELFKEAGYATGAFLTHSYLAPRWNYLQGVDRYNQFHLEDVHDSRVPKKDRAYRRLREALEWVDEIGEQPYFLWFQSQLTHYFPQAGERFVSAEDLQRAKEFRQRVKGMPMGRIMFAFDSLGETPQVSDSLISMHDAAVARTDEIFGLLLRGLRERGRLAKTVMVVTVDHGETLGERKLMFNHDSNVLEPTVHVPLLLHIPGREPTEIFSASRNIDLLPTLTALVGLEVPQDVDGQSLLPLLEGEEPELPVFSETRPQVSDRVKYAHYPIGVPGVAGKVRMIRQANLKLIHTPTPEGFRAELYNLVADPGETSNLADQQPETARRLGRKLERWFAGYEGADTAPLELEEQDLESLRALGYID